MFFQEMNTDIKEKLENTYKYILQKLYPDKYEPDREMEGAEDYIIILERVRKHIAKCKVSYMDGLELLDNADINGSHMAEEYKRFQRFWNDNYLPEFMYIGRELTPYNTFGHVCGVHYVALHVAKQMKQAGFPVDLALVSAAAASHDLGKYGCTGDELLRVPYLHYYYTEELMKRNGMPVTARIAGNHSVWDLERDLLSAEWMILIYSDFRVKSSRDESGREIIKISSLEEAFQVILEKLDNVDEEKASRYKRAYARLKKFEEYMIYMGVDPDLDGYRKEPEYDPERSKQFMMLDYQLRIASKFNYLTQDKIEKMLVLLADSFEGRSHEAKKQTVMIMRELLRNYDWKNNKELPSGIIIAEPEKSAAELAEQYKEILKYDETTERVI